MAIRTTDGVGDALAVAALFVVGAADIAATYRVRRLAGAVTATLAALKIA